MKKIIPATASATCRRGLAALLALLLLGLLTPALAQETCGTDPATSPNHSDNYILGEIEGEVADSVVGAAMNWETGLVWKRCAQGLDGVDCSGGSYETRPWNDWMAEFMPRSFAGQDSWWSTVGPYTPNPATGPVGVDRLQDGTWRMPYRKELEGLTTDCTDGPKINRNVFPNTSGSSFWSGSPSTSGHSALFVGFHNGNPFQNSRYYEMPIRLVRAGQPFAHLSTPAPRTEAAGSQTAFAPVTLAPFSGSGTAWGGARISGAGNPEFSLDGGTTWVTEAIVQSGDAITVRMMAGAVGDTHTATLSLRSGETEGAADGSAPGSCPTCGHETTALAETTADFTVTAVNVHTLNYTAGPGGTLTGNASQTVIQGGDGSPVTAVPDVNYHFVGWDDGLTTATRTDTNVQADLDVTAAFAINSYTVTFVDWDASVLDTQTVEHGSAATAPADPNRTGYTFTGWDVSFANITSDLTVTAQYDINSYTVTFVDWDASVLSTQVVNHGNAATAPADPTRTGYTFTGWDMSFANVTSDLTVTAQYDINSYTVTFVDWDASVLDTQTVDHGSDAVAPADPTRTGYTFTGWDVDYTNVTSDLAVTAQYDLNSYTVTFVDWDASVLETQTVDHGSDAVAPADPTRTGYTFTGWDVSFANITADLTVTAQYDINTYTVTASVSGGNGSISPASQSVDYGDTVSITVTPDAGYHAVMPAGGDCPAGSLSGDQYTTGTITADCTVTVSFDQNSAEGLTVQGGDGQDVPVLDGFPVALTVRVADAGDVPLQGVTVNFAAPASGASAVLSATSVVTDANGIASVSATANEIAGSYEVEASVGSVAPNPAPGAASVMAAAPVVFSLTNSALASSLDLAISPTPVPPGRTATLTATVTGSGSLTPGGTVDFLVDGVVVCTAVPVDASGIATCSAGPFAGGQHDAEARYSGDASHDAATGALAGGFVAAAAIPVPVNHPLALLLLMLSMLMLGVMALDSSTMGRRA